MKTLNYRGKRGLSGQQLIAKYRSRNKGRRRESGKKVLKEPELSTTISIRIRMEAQEYVRACRSACIFVIVCFYPETQITVNKTRSTSISADCVPFGASNVASICKIGDVVVGTTSAEIKR